MRVLRPLLWLVVAGAAVVAFVALGGLTEVPIRWGDLGGWLDEVSVEAALVELARWVGLALAVYVTVVAALVLLGEVASSVRAVPVARLLGGAARLVAVPALRRRLVEASTATAITVSAMSATAGGAALAVSPVTSQTVDVDAASTELRVVAVDLNPALGTPSTSADPGAEDDPAALGPPGEVRRVVAPGDTVWDLAVEVYGFCDGAVVERVAVASSLGDPNLIYVGQTLVFPVLAVETGGHPGATPPLPAGAATWSTHTVVIGDTLWGILDGFYGYVDADLVWAYAGWAGLEDPGNITVATLLTLPPAEVLTGAPSEPTPAAPTPTPSPPAAASLSPHPTTSPLPVEESGPPVEDEAPLPVREQAMSQTPASSSPTSVEPDAAPTVTADDDGGVLPSWLAGLAGATTLSVGLLAVYRRLRRRQGSVGARAWRLMPSGESARLYRQLVAAADVPLVRWAGQELSGVLFGLGRAAAGPVAVELSELTGLELLWDGPMLSAPSAWEATSGGWSWRLLYDPAAEVPASVLPAAVPGLVTVGRRHDAQVLVDLEAFGSVAIVGDARAAEDVVRAMVLELGAGEELSDAWVTTVGLGIDGVEHLGRVQVRTGDEALRHAEGIVADGRRVMEDAGVEGSFALRAAGPATTREVTVIAAKADTGAVVAELVALATPRSGVAVVVLGDVGGVGLRAVVDAGGAMELVELGIEVEAVGVSREVAANTAVLLDAAADVVFEDLDAALGADVFVAEDHAAGIPSEESADGIDVDDAGAVMIAGERSVAEEVAALSGPDGVDLDAAGELLGGAEPAEVWARPTPSLLVRVMGRPRLEPEPEGLSRFERLMTVYVASMGGEASASSVRDAVWGGKLVADKRFWNVVSTLRSHLGSTLCPARPVGSDRVRLVDTMTDLQLLEVLVAEAKQVPWSEALPLLLEGLSLVDGEPFDDAGYDWAIDEQLPFKAAELIEAAALRAVELALGADDVVSAREAVVRALVGLPGNEVLYRARMRIEAHAGNRAGVRSVYAELVAVLQDLSGDTADGGDPSPLTRQLLAELVESRRQ